MKSLFPYLVMIALFVAGTRLVNRQQNYIRSLQEADSGRDRWERDSANVFVRADYSLASGQLKLTANQPEAEE